MEDIKHEGTVLSSGPGSVRVRFEQNKACAGCQASGICSTMSSGERIIDIESANRIEAGSLVEVSISKSKGYLALFLGYLLPLIILLTVLFILTGLSAGELTAALAATGVTGLYYLGLYLFREKITNKFTFRVQKIS